MTDLDLTPRQRTIFLLLLVLPLAGFAAYALAGVASLVMLPVALLTAPAAYLLGIGLGATEPRGSAVGLGSD